MIERVVELAEIAECLNHAADFMVAVRRISGEHFDLPDEQLLLLGAELIPRLQQFVRPRRELGVFRHHAEPLLVCEDARAQLLVAVVEEVHRVDLVDPFLRRMVRRVRSARRVLDEDRPARVGLVDARHPVDRVIGHRSDQVPGTSRLAEERIDLRGVAEQVRLPLVRVAADETVEVLEAHAGGPLVERTDLAGRERRHVVIFAEPRGRVAVVEQHAADRRLVLPDDAVVAGVAGRLLRRSRQSRRSDGYVR